MSVPTLHERWQLADGSVAQLLAYEGGLLRLRSVHAWAPGAPMTLSSASLPSPNSSLQGRAIGSKRQADGSFEVRVRLVNLRREQRRLLEAASQAR